LAHRRLFTVGRHESKKAAGNSSGGLSFTEVREALYLTA